MQLDKILKEGKRINLLGEQKERAISNQNAILYYLIINKLGQEPELPDLYERGELETRIRKEREQKDEELARKENYKSFYREVLFVDKQVSKISVKTMKELLMKYFPYRFDEKWGERTTKNQICGAYRGCVNLAKKYSGVK